MSRGKSLIANEVFPEITEKLRQGGVVTTVQIRESLVRHGFLESSVSIVTGCMGAGYFEEVTGVRPQMLTYRVCKLYFDAAQATSSGVVEEKVRRRLETDERKAR